MADHPLSICPRRSESGPINFAAMVNHMNRYGMLSRIRCVEHAPITNLAKCEDCTMTQTPIDRETLKQTLKEALSEALHEERELLHKVFAEVLEDFALGEAIREGLE